MNLTVSVDDARRAPAILVRGDSANCTEWLSGTRRLHEKAYRGTIDDLQTMQGEWYKDNVATPISYREEWQRWIPREQNNKADALASRASAGEKGIHCTTKQPRPVAMLAGTFDGSAGATAGAAWTVEGRYTTLTGNKIYKEWQAVASGMVPLPAGTHAQEAEMVACQQCYVAIDEILKVGRVEASIDGRVRRTTMRGRTDAGKLSKGHRAKRIRAC